MEGSWRQFSDAVFGEGTLEKKTKQLIAVAVAHVTQCPDCLRGRTQGAQREGASEHEVMEAISVGTEMGAGGAVAHSRQMFNALERGY